MIRLIFSSKFLAASQDSEEHIYIRISSIEIFDFIVNLKKYSQAELKKKSVQITNLKLVSFTNGRGCLCMPSQKIRPLSCKLTTSRVERQMQKFEIGKNVVLKSCSWTSGIQK